MAFIKSYKNQEWLLPPRLEDLIPEDHICYFIDEIVDSIDFSSIEARYEGPGHPAYHPKIIIKLLITGMIDGVRSSRKIAKNVRENVVYMFLAGKLKPDFRTISDFRKNNQELIKFCFKEVVSIAKQLDMVGLESLCIDGSKIKANASTGRTLTKEELLFIDGFIKNEISKGIEEDLTEDELYGEDKSGYETLKLREKIEETNLKSRNGKLLRKILRDFLEGDEVKRERIKETIDKAKSQIDQDSVDSVSLTDPESRFMKNKKGYTEYSYNPQITVDSKYGIILANDVVQQCTDKEQLIPQIEKCEENVGKLPEGTKINADNGYYKTDNLRYLSDRKLDGYIPDNLSSQRLKGKIIEKNPFGKESFVYDPAKDEFICPANERITFRYSYFDRSRKSNVRIYKSKRSDCENCKYYDQCVKNKKGVRIIKSPGFEIETKIMADKFESEAGREEYKIRARTVERVYGDIKQNMGFREFRTRGTNKVEMEYNLVSTAYNLKRMWNVLKANARLGLYINSNTTICNL